MTNRPQLMHTRHQNRKQFPEVAAGLLYVLSYATAPLYLGALPVMGQVLVALVPAIILFSYNRHGFAHPVNCILPLLLLAVISFPVYRLVSGSYDGLTSDVMAYHLVFSAFVAIPFLFAAPDRGCAVRIRSASWATASLAGWAALAVGTVSFVGVVASGATSKREVISSSTFLELLANYSLIAAPACCAIVELRRLRFLGSKKWYPAKLTWATVAVLLLGLLIIGERDLLFRWIVVAAVFIFDFFRRYRPWYATAFFALLLVLAPLSQGLKSAALNLGGGNEDGVVNNFRSTEKIFAQEFSTSGRNLYYLLAGKEADHGMRFYIAGIKRSLYIGPRDNAVRWFHEVFRPRAGIDGASGWGFSLVGEAYISFGVIGIMVLGVAYGSILAILYRRRLVSEYAYVWYTLAIYGFAYVQRGDVANFIAFVIKVPAMILVVIVVLTYFSSNHRKERLAIPGVKVL